MELAQEVDDGLGLDYGTVKVLPNQACKNQSKKIQAWVNLP
jgi:hypothetical protein